MRRIHRLPAWSATGDQPAQWTLIDFTYPQEAVAYARDVGVPEAQLDWPR